MTLPFAQLRVCARVGGEVRVRRERQDVFNSQNKMAGWSDFARPAELGPGPLSFKVELVILPEHEQ